MSSRPLPPHEVDEDIHLTAYKAHWVEHGDFVVHEVLSALADVCSAVEHVGSTAVPGMLAKPIIDVMAAVEPDAVGIAASRLGSLGFEDLGEAGVVGRRYLRRRRRMPLANAHLLVPEGDLWHNNLALRNYLRTHDDVAAEYAAVKTQASRGNARLLAYSDSKAPFVDDVVRRARLWSDC